MSKTIVKSWLFGSSSNPTKSYETLQYDDGSTSCNCPGWTRRCVGGVRVCKHTKYVEDGIADSQAQGASDYTKKTVKAPTPKAKAPEKIQSVASPSRRVVW